jgi:HlyD family secretion protein
VGTHVDGQLEEVRVNIGATVTRGQVLATFASETVTAELAEARANLSAAEARLSEAAADGESARRLRNTGALSEQRISQLVTAEHTARAELAVRAAALALAQLRLRQTRVVAPDDGVISARTATVGAVSTAGQELFRLIRQDRLEWRAEVASHELALLQPGALANVQGPDGSSVQGTVRMVAPNVDPQSRLGLIYVDLPKGTGLRAGMFAKGEFELERSAVLTVPHSAVLLRDGFSYVFGVGADQRVSQIKVQIGRRQGERIEVIGLAAEAALVKSGVGFLNDGDVVKVIAGQQMLAGN